MACSAVVMELPNGVFITMMPLAVAAGMSTLSTPMPARPITFRFLAFSRILGVTLVAERMARPSKPPMISASLSLSLPSAGWKSTSMPRSLKICTAAGDRASEMRTLGMGSLHSELGEGKAAYAAFGSAALVWAKAQSSQAVSASTSLASTVAPHQMRRPGGASR